MRGSIRSGIIKQTTYRTTPEHLLIFRFLKPPRMSPRLHRLKSSSLFSTLTPLELKIVDGLLHERRYLKDEIVFDEGEEGQALYLVMSGRVIISREFGAGREIVAELSAGSFFGDLALLDNARATPRRGRWTTANWRYSSVPTSWA